MDFCTPGPAGGFLSNYSNDVLNDRSIPMGRSYILPGLFIDVHLTGLYSLKFQVNRVKLLDLTVKKYHLGQIRAS